MERNGEYAQDRCIHESLNHKDFEPVTADQQSTSQRQTETTKKTLLQVLTKEQGKVPRISDSSREPPVVCR